MFSGLKINDIIYILYMGIKECPVLCFVRAVEILRMASATNHMSLLIARDEESRYASCF